MTMMQMYWLTRMDSIYGFFSGLMVFSIIGALFTGIYFIACIGEYHCSERNLCKKLLKYLFIPLSLLFSSLVVFMPTSKEMAAIIVVPKIVNNEKIQKGTENLIDLANEWMLKTKEDMEGEKKHE